MSVTLLYMFVFNIFEVAYNVISKEKFKYELSKIICLVLKRITVSGRVRKKTRRGIFYGLVSHSEYKTQSARAKSDYLSTFHVIVYL